MKKCLSSLAAAAFAASLVVPAYAADITVKGEVVDIACSTSKGAGGRGDAHAACAMACAKKGQPVGILTADAVYEITGDYAANKNAKLLDFVAKQVTVSGEVTEKDGKKLLNVKSIAVAK
jgi:molybdopterin-guanine dinucleotide biosynthesis protein A